MTRHTLKDKAETDSSESMRLNYLIKIANIAGTKFANATCQEQRFSAIGSLFYRISEISSGQLSPEAMKLLEHIYLWALNSGLGQEYPPLKKNKKVIGKLTLADWLGRAYFLAGYKLHERAGDAPAQAEATMKRVAEGHGIFIPEELSIRDLSKNFTRAIKRNILQQEGVKAFNMYLSEFEKLKQEKNFSSREIANLFTQLRPLIKR
jgi:hypothetical protein